MTLAGVCWYRVWTGAGRWWSEGGGWQAAGRAHRDHCSALAVGTAGTAALVVTALSLMAVVPAAADEKGPWARRPFSAEMLRYTTSEPEPRQRSRIFMGPFGLREEAGPPQGPVRLIVIANRDTGEGWLVDPRRELVLAMPRSDDAGEDDEPEGVLSPEPCSGYPLRDRYGDARHDGRPVVKWRCRDPRTGEDRWQWYDPDIGVVVREERWDGRVEELVDIRPGRQARELFVPPRNMRRTGMKEFFTGVPEFPRYRETGEEGNLHLDAPAPGLPDYSRSAPGERSGTRAAGQER